MRSPNYEGEHQKALRANAAAIPKLLKAGDDNLLEKVTNFAARFGFDLKDVLKKVEKDVMFAAHFAVSPSRQNIYENIAAQHIGTLPNVKNFQKLPTGALSVSQGAVMSRAELARHGGRSGAKTVDFTWEVGKTRVYASHKYTKEEGGAQDNQYQDLQQFIKEARDSSLKSTVFIAIADGPYYKGRRLKNLKSLANGRNVFALSIDELPGLLKKFST